MGCCLSAGKVTAPPISAAQIPPQIEEESVKEVVVVQSVSDIVPSANQVSDSEAPHLPPSHSHPSPPQISLNKSDVSHSFSTATTATAASILEDDALSKPHRPPPPPPSSSTSRRRNIPDRVSRSPGGRNSPQGKLRERQSNQANRTHNLRNVDSCPLPRSGLMDGPRRRSRSPATRGPSPARGSPMKKRQVAEVKVKKEEEKLNVDVKKEEDEMSMECFIFL